MASTNNPTPISLQPYAGNQTLDQALWSAIRNRTTAIGFDRYQRYIDCVFCSDSDRPVRVSVPSRSSDDKIAAEMSACIDGETEGAVNPCGLSFQGPYAYQILKLATQAFLLIESGIVINEKILSRKVETDGEKVQPELESERRRWGEATLTP